MARKNQQLINYHTSGASNMPNVQDVQYGEIAVRHNAEKPEILIKISGETGETFAKFVDEQKVQQLITNTGDNLASAVSGNTQKINELSGSVVENYATSADTESAIATAKDEAIAAASAYSDTVKQEAIEAASADTVAAQSSLQGQIDSHTATLTALTASAETLDAKFDGYYTSAETDTNIATAKDEAIAAASAYSDTVKQEAIEAASADTVGVQANLQGQIDAHSASISGLSADIESLQADFGGYYTSAETDTKIATAKDEAIAAASAYTDQQVESGYTAASGLVYTSANALQANIDSANSRIDTVSSGLTTLSGDLVTYVDTRVSSVYRVKGSKATYAELPSSDNEVGDVWNVVAANGDTPAGTNYVWNGSAWDALGGSIDMSPYALSSEVDEAIAGITSATSASISGLSADIDALEEKFDDYYTSGETDTKISTAKSEAIAAASADTVGVQTNLQGQIDTINASVSAISATSNTAVQTVDFAGADAAAKTASASGAAIARNGNDVTFDFSNLVIDCGDF